jgi:GcrA cell cycle regulator
MTWDDEQVERLKELWALDYSCSEIAAELGGGITRNAVIGKVHRLGLDGRKESKYKRTNQAKPSRRHPFKLRRYLDQHPEFDCVAVEPLHITLDDLKPHHCRAICGDNPFTYCGHPKLDGASYCPSHYRAFYVTPIKPTARAA